MFVSCVVFGAYCMWTKFQWFFFILDSTCWLYNISEHLEQLRVKFISFCLGSVTMWQPKNTRTTKHNLHQWNPADMSGWVWDPGDVILLDKNPAPVDIFPRIPSTIKTMGVNITTIAYLRFLIIEIRSTIILMVVEAQGIENVSLFIGFHL